MAGCDVCIGGFDGDSCDFFGEEIRKARKPHECSECRKEIAKRDRYQRCYGKNEGEFWSFDTCLLCAEIRKVFTCGEGETLGGMLWESMNDCAFPNLTFESPCFRELSIPAKNEVLRRWQEWKGLKGISGVTSGTLTITE